MEIESAHAQVTDESGFEVFVYDGDGGRVVVARGKADISALDVMEAANDVPGDAALRLDLPGVTVLDSSAFGAFTRAVRNRAPVPMVASDPVRRVLYTAATENLFDLS
jgi:hypothetical protein